MRRAMIFVLLILTVGCNRPAPAPATAPSTSAHAPPKLPPLEALQCKLSVVAPLLPKRITHLTIDPSSNVYFLQETDDFTDTMFIVGSDGVSSTMPVTSRGILAAIDQKGTGTIQSIAAAADGNIYFFFSGGTPKQTIVCLGRFETRTGLIRILARENALADASQMGDSLALARGELVAAGKSVWLWLHHPDASVMFNLRPGEFPAEGEIQLPPPTAIRSADGTLNMTRGQPQLSTGPGDSIFLLDTYSAALWTIDLNGKADVVQSLVGLPTLLSTPGVNRVGDVVFFAAASEPIEPRVEQRIAPVNVDTHYPSLLVLRGGDITPIPRDDIHADPMFPLYAMQLQQVLYEPGRDTWIGYDVASGQIVRMTLGSKRSR
jgi:hypothetical protein